MKKGTLVELREEVFSDSEEMAMLSSSGYPLLLHRTPYTLSCDPKDYMCKSCGKPHPGIQLEEFPDLLFNGNHFKEVLKPEEVNIEALLEA